MRAADDLIRAMASRPMAGLPGAGGTRTVRAVPGPGGLAATPGKGRPPVSPRPPMRVMGAPLDAGEARGGRAAYARPGRRDHGLGGGAGEVAAAPERTGPAGAAYRGAAR